MTGELAANLAKLLPGPTAELHPAIGRARAALISAMGALVGVPDDALVFGWEWRGHQADVRHGFYSLYEELEQAASAASRRLADRPDTEARESVGAATSARWDLHGALAGLPDADLDADPGGGEWTLRQTLAHMTHSQRGYSIFNAWYAAERPAVVTRDSPMPSDQVVAMTGDEERDGEGSLTEILRRLDGLVDEGSARLGQLDDQQMAGNGRWSGIPVPLGYRMWRWSSHLREHTVQVDKTLAMLGRQPSEAQRLARLIAAAYGRLEAVAFARAASDVDAVASTFEAFAASALATSRSVPAAAAARVAVTEF